MKFLKEFKSGGEVFVEDSVLWYALDMGVDHYMKMNIHERINFKASYLNPEKVAI